VLCWTKSHGRQAGQVNSMACMGTHAETALDSRVCGMRACSLRLVSLLMGHVKIRLAFVHPMRGEHIFSNVADFDTFGYVETYDKMRQTLACASINIKHPHPFSEPLACVTSTRSELHD
jgi:hypothetical protein